MKMVCKQRGCEIPEDAEPGLCPVCQNPLFGGDAEPVAPVEESVEESVEELAEESAEGAPTDYSGEYRI